MDKITVNETESNIDDARNACSASDQADALTAGAETWGITYEGGQRGQMTRWIGGRGAVSFGADSQWGYWYSDVLHTDDGEAYDEDGVEVEDPEVNSGNFREHLDTLGYYGGECFESAEQVSEYLESANVELSAPDGVPFSGRAIRWMARLAASFREHWAE